MVVSGGSIDLGESVTLKTVLPERATVKIIRNGSVVAQTDSKTLEFRATDPGLYRVEAWKGSRGWIFSNHIRVGLPDPGPA